MDEIKNMIGLEAEFFVKGKDGKLDFPSDSGFETDEFIILGEFRAKPADNVAECLANFYKEYFEVLERAKKKGKTIDIKRGYEIIDKTFFATILKRLGTKEINQSRNIYGTEILEMSDALIKDDKVIGQKLSIGLHVHFSSSIINQRSIAGEKYTYTPITIPIAVGTDKTITTTLYDKKEILLPTGGITATASVSRITVPVIKYIIKEFDDKILPEFKLEETLKYRQPGYYELKDWGFEYRSLPFNLLVLDNMFKIVSFAFEKLEEL